MKNIDVVSLEVAQKLQKAGWEGECEYSWKPDKFRGSFELTGEFFLVLTKENSQNLQVGQYLIPAPTTTQLAEELPKEIYEKFKDEEHNSVGFLNISWTIDRWRIEYEHEDDFFFNVHGKTLPDTLGLMRAYLLENGLMK